MGKDIRPVVRLLLQVFSPAEFEAWLAHVHEGTQDLRSLLPSGESHAQRVYAVVDAMARRGLLGSAMWDDLAEMRPRRAGEIRAVQNTFSGPAGERREPLLLWVDDWPASLGERVQALHDRGIRVVTATTTEDAVQLVAGGLPVTAVLSDLHRGPPGEPWDGPGQVPLAGVRLLAELRYGARSDVPFVLITTSGNRAQHGDVVRALGGQVLAEDEVPEQPSDQTWEHRWVSFLMEKLAPPRAAHPRTQPGT